MSTTPPDLHCFLAEWYGPRPVGDTLAHTTAKLDECAVAVTAQGSPVRLLMTLALPSDEVMFALFDAPSADDVARICDQAGIPAERLTPAVDGGLTETRRRSIGA
jgi:hypothetical protein